MLERSRHPKIAEFLRVCSKPLAIMMEYECFDFTLFGIDHQVSDLLKLSRRGFEFGHSLLPKRKAYHCIDQAITVCFE